MKQNRKYLILLFIIVSLIACFVIQKVVARQDTLEYLQQLDAEIESFAQLQGEYPTYLVTDNGGNESYIVETESSGYGGPLTLLAQFKLNGNIKHVMVTDHCETPLYFNKLSAAGFPESLVGKAPEELLAIARIDGVSGATMSAEAVLAASQKAAAYIGTQYLDMDIKTTLAATFDTASIILLAFYAVIIVIMHLKYTKARPLIMVASVFLLGFYCKTFLSFSNLVSFLIGKFPSFTERPAWYLLVVGVIMITLVSGRNIYCTYLCPFGAVQEGIYRALHLTQINPARRLVRAARTIRWIVIWLILALALLLNQPGIASYEPFGVFFSGQGSTGQWIIMVMVLVLDMWWFRLWCRYFCPVGAILDIAAAIKNTLAQRKASKREIPHAHFNNRCTGECAEPALVASDKVFLVILVLFNVLIVHTIISAVLAL